MSTEETNLPEEILERFDNFVAAAQGVIEQYGGDATNLALNTLRIDAASSLVTGVLFLCLWIGVAYTIRKFILHQVPIKPVSYTKAEIRDLIQTSYHRRTTEEDRVLAKIFNRYAPDQWPLETRFQKMWDETTFPVTGYPSRDAKEFVEVSFWLIWGVCIVFCALTIAFNFLSIWNWIGIFYPEAYALHKFLL